MFLLSALTCVHHPMSLSRTSVMRTTNWLCLACDFWVVINEQSDMTAECKFQFLPNNASSYFSFCAFVLQLLFVGAQVLETWLTCVCWHLTWNSWIVSIEIERQCLFNTRFSSFNFHLYLLRNSKVLFARAVVSRRLSGKILTCSWYVACGGVVRPALVIFPISLIHPLVLQLCECPFETITLPILFYQFTMLRFSVFILHLLGFYSSILNWIMLLLLHNETV